MPLDLNLPDAAATAALGAALAPGAGPGWVLYLRGDLGTGKTTLARVIANGWNVECSCFGKFEIPCEGPVGTSAAGDVPIDVDES